MVCLAAERWAKARTFHHSLYPAARIAAERTCSVSVCLCAGGCEATVREIVSVLAGLREAGVLDELLVVDVAAPDGGAAAAKRAGANVVRGLAPIHGSGPMQDVEPTTDVEPMPGSGPTTDVEPMPGSGPVLGKGDAMWRALSVLSGELVVFLDAGGEGFSEHFITGLLGPLVCEPDVAFVKAFHQRPVQRAGGSPPEGGGRVNHLMARPALSLFYPELAAVRQPLAGEVAARRELLESIPFVAGDGVEVAMLIDVWRELGLYGIAQVDLESHRNRHQSPPALPEMSEIVLATIVHRLEGEARASPVNAATAPVERPALATLMSR